MHVKLFSALAFLVSTKSKVHNIKCNYCYVNNIDLKYSLLDQKKVDPWVLVDSLVQNPHPHCVSDCQDVEITPWYLKILIELKNMF